VIYLCIESSHTRGMGHLYRSLTLADALCARGHAVRFLINDHAPSLAILRARGYEPAIVNLTDMESGWENAFKKGATLWVNDRLDTHAIHAQRIKNAGLALVTFDDRGSGAAFADLHIAALNFDETPPAGKNILRGVEYLLLSPDIARYQRLRKKVDSLLVTLGGSDTHGATVKVVKLLAAQKQKATLVLGPSFAHHTELEAVLTPDFTVKNGVPSMPEEMAHHDLAITGGGMTPFEANAAGLPCIVVANEDFEIPNGQKLEQLGGSLFAGHHANIDASIFSRALPIEAMSRAGLEHIGLGGAARVVAALEALL